MKTREPKIKRKWRGAFNFNQSARVMYAYAYSKAQAWSIMCRRIAESDGVGVLTVMGKFRGDKDNFEITEEKPNG